MPGTTVWYLTIATLVGISGMFLWGMYTQLINGIPWGDKPMSDMGLLIVGGSSILLMIGLTVFISLHKLTLEIDREAFYVKFNPYFKEPKVFRKAELQSATVRKYQPIMEFGGWGLRIGLKKSKAYNITGNYGLQLVFTDGSKLLIGTRNEKELEAAVEKFNADG